MNDKDADDGVLQAAADWWTRLRDPRRRDDAAARWLEWTRADPRRIDAFERIDELASRLVALDDEARDDLLREFAPAARARRAWPATGLVAAACLVAVIGATLLAWPRLVPPTAEGETYATAIAVERDLALGDGSRVALGAASQLRTHFATDVRAVELAAGEAYFQVAHDTRRPFIVSAGPVSIRAVGTAFNVRRTGDRVTIAVTEGRVRIAGSDGDSMARTSAADALEAVAGQQVSYDPRASGLAVVGISPAQATGWRDHRLEFVNEPLEVVVANINRYSPRPLRIVDAQVGMLAFTGTVRPDALDGWLRALGKILPVRVTTTADGVALSAATEHKAR
ncbi:MAG: FecR domain-containing protein [Rudaea sp.]